MEKIYEYMTMEEYKEFYAKHIEMLIANFTYNDLEFLFNYVTSGIDYDKGLDFKIKGVDLTLYFMKRKLSIKITDGIKIDPKISYENVLELKKEYDIKQEQKKLQETIDFVGSKVNPKEEKRKFKL